MPGTKRVTSAERWTYLKRMLPIAWPFILIVTLLVLLQWACLDMLSAGRAFVGGESMWSKGQKDAIYYLERYASTLDEREYQAYENAISVPLGDQRARRALDMTEADLYTAREGLLAGGNMPEDVPGMIRLYRNFRHIGFINEAIDLWAQADEHIAHLQRLADELHNRAGQKDVEPARIVAIRAEIQQINERLTPIENGFSTTVAKGLRQTSSWIAYTYLIAAIALIALALRRTGKLMHQRSQSEDALRASEARFQRAVGGSNDGIWDWDLLTGHSWFSPRFRHLLGVTEEELPNRADAWLARVHPEDKTIILNAHRRHFNDGEPHDIEYRVRTGHAGDGAYRWFRVRGRAFFDEAGNPVRMAGSFTDVTRSKAAEAALHREKEKAQVTLASIGDAVITTDTVGRVEYMNPAAERMILTQWDQAMQQPLDSLFKAMDPGHENAAVSLLGEIRHYEAAPMDRDLNLVRNDGSEISVNRAIAPVHDRDGRVTGVVLVLHDVTRERQYAASLSWQASHDALTGLVNRREFERRLSALHARLVQRAAEHALMFMDLDQFKIVNDTCGHAAGDELLRQLSGVLQQHLRQSDTLARIGGDEFGVLLENCSIDAATRIAETLRQTVLDFPFSFGSQSFTVGVSIGLVEMADASMTPEEALRAADAACYMAKEKGRNRMQLYSPQDSEVSQRHGEMEWVNRLRRALEKNQFRLYAQEIVSLKGEQGRRHVEVLLRLSDDQGQMIPPMAFIPAAERYNLMPEIDRWVLRNTLETLSARDRAGLEPLAICAINLSGTSIGDEHFLGYVLDQIKRSGVDASRLCFELTETSAIASLTRATHFMQQLSELGCKFALDDFGAGMSSFGYLKHLPVDYLKIDGGFVKDMLSDPIDRAMVGAINEIGHLMGKKTVAEFVENQAIADTLRDMGVDYAQGYGVAPPEPFRLLRSDVSPSWQA
ncbi:EAL domain-containing protein [Silvimonas sp.]|uniref:EAL domain-containing protein n=1 Tax=Silvimonas sp. TaxID=2650811 RepID=UPI002848FE13|nr:EAL domain-containing protein [Silvimonas sp.]MDR3427295.1 EAL domain-containing protein [Silvimonas sp.]